MSLEEKSVAGGKKCRWRKKVSLEENVSLEEKVSLEERWRWRPCVIQWGGMSECSA